MTGFLSNNLDKINMPKEEITSILTKSLPTLMNEYNLIGKGNSRNVFDLGNGYVVKVSRNVNENLSEWKLWNTVPSNLRELLNPCYYDSNYPEKIIMPLAEKVSFNDLTSFVYEKEGPEKALAVSNGIYELTEKHNLVYFDLTLSTNWGLLNGKCKLIDYGLTINKGR